jgi:hypothetical protein
MMRWGMPPPPRTGGPPVTNVRNTSSPHWRGWLKAGPYRWVKSGPDALEVGCLHYPRRQTSVSYAADADVIVCYDRCIALTTRLSGGCSVVSND